VQQDRSIRYSSQSHVHPASASCDTLLALNGSDVIVVTDSVPRYAPSRFAEREAKHPPTYLNTHYCRPPTFPTVTSGCCVVISYIGSSVLDFGSVTISSATLIDNPFTWSFGTTVLPSNYTKSALQFKIKMYLRLLRGTSPLERPSSN
jgi:hypothetical protein